MLLSNFTPRVLCEYGSSRLTKGSGTRPADSCGDRSVAEFRAMKLLGAQHFKGTFFTKLKGHFVK